MVEESTDKFLSEIDKEYAEIIERERKKLMKDMETLSKIEKKMSDADKDVVKVSAPTGVPEIEKVSPKVPQISTIEIQRRFKERSMQLEAEYREKYVQFVKLLEKEFKEREEELRLQLELEYRKKLKEAKAQLEEKYRKNEAELRERLETEKLDEVKIQMELEHKKKLREKTEQLMNALKSALKQERVLSHAETDKIAKQAEEIETLRKKIENYKRLETEVERLMKIINVQSDILSAILRKNSRLVYEVIKEYEIDFKDVEGMIKKIG